MKNKILKIISLISLSITFLLCSCEDEPQPQKGHLLRVIVYYSCPEYSTSFLYPGAPSKEDYGIYQVLVKINDDNLTGEMLEEMNSRVTACGVQNFEGVWYSDSDLTTPLTEGKLSCRFEDNYYNYMAYTKVEEDLTPRFTQYIVRDSENIYRLNTYHEEIFPVDTKSVSFTDELRNHNYNPYEVSKVYYINPETDLVDKEWQPGQPLQGKKLFVDINSTWSNQRYIKFVNSVQRTSPNREPNYLCKSITGSKKIRDFYPNIFNNTYEYLKIYKGKFLPNGEIEWNKNKVYSADDSLNPYELIRIDTCIPKLNIYMIDSNGNTQDFTAQYDIAYTFAEDSDFDTIKNGDLGEIGNIVQEERNIVHVENSSWIPKAYYKIKTADTQGMPAEVVWTLDPDSAYSYIQIKDDCKIDKLKNEIYILVEGTL